MGNMEVEGAAMLPGFLALTGHSVVMARLGLAIHEFACDRRELAQ